MVADTFITEEAPAKINLYLHVTGKRDDGYHLLDSLVVFADVGDRITAAPSPVLSLDYTGPFASSLPRAEDNLVFRAAAMLKDMFGVTQGCALTLDKRLPVASGIGGGSADAAATLRALCRVWALDNTDPRISDLALSLGADIPVCMAGYSTIMRGIGEDLHPVRPPSPVHLILVNPGVEVSTPSVFKSRTGAFSEAVVFPDADMSQADFQRILTSSRNDLQDPAISLQHVIGDVLNALEALPGVALARMSGSGATCFAITESAADARDGVTTLASLYPAWWAQATQTK